MDIVDASGISKTASQSKFFLRGLENLSVPLTDSVIIRPAAHKMKTPPAHS